MKYLRVGFIVLVLAAAGFFVYSNFAPKQSSSSDNPQVVQNFSGCKTYTNLQEALSQPSDVCKLDLSSQGLQTLPAEIGKMENLREFYVQGNALTGFPAEVGRFKKLEVLNISSNKITGIPAEIGHLPNLGELDLSSNQFDAMPQEFAELKNLRKLSLANNNYRDIPNEIYSMSSLEELSISGNQLSQEQIDALKQKLPRVNVN